MLMGASRLEAVPPRVTVAQQNPGNAEVSILRFREQVDEIVIVGEDNTWRFLIPSEEEPTSRRFSLAQIFDLLKNERAPVGISIGLYLLPVLQVPAHSFPFW